MKEYHFVGPLNGEWAGLRWRQRSVRYTMRRIQRGTFVRKVVAHERVAFETALGYSQRGRLSAANSHRLLYFKATSLGHPLLLIYDDRYGTYDLFAEHFRENCWVLMRYCDHPRQMDLYPRPPVALEAFTDVGETAHAAS